MKNARKGGGPDPAVEAVLAKLEPEDRAVVQGALERANVDVVEEMVGLISAQRSYEINSKVITAADEMLRAATQLR